MDVFEADRAFEIKWITIKPIFFLLLNFKMQALDMVLINLPRDPTVYFREWMSVDSCPAVNLSNHLVGLKPVSKSDSNFSCFVVRTYVLIFTKRSLPRTFLFSELNKIALFLHHFSNQV